MAVGLSKSQDKDQTTKEIYGNYITAKILKSRVSRENTSVTMKMSYSTGLDRYYGLLDIAVKYGIVQKLSTKYQFPGHDKGEFEKRIYKNPEKYFTVDVLKLIDEACKKEFTYGANDAPSEDDVDDFEG